MINKDGVARKDCPVWLTSTGVEFKPNGKAEIIASIFTDYLNNVGVSGICRKLNAEMIATLGGKGTWHQPIICRLLTDARVTGDIKINGKIIKGYYPAIVSEETFAKAQSKMADNRGKRTTKHSGGRINNLFSGILFCKCGTKIQVAHSKGGTNYCTCYGKRDGTTNCVAPMAKYNEFEMAALNIVKLNPSQLLTDDNGNGINSQMQILRGRKIEVEKAIQDAKEMVSFAMKNKQMAVLQEINNNLEALNTQLGEIEQQITIESAKTISNKTSIDRLTDVLDSLQAVTTDNNVRLKVQAWFRENVNRITFNRVNGEFDVDLKNGGLLSMNLSGVILGTKSLSALFALSKGQDTAANALHQLNAKKA